MGSEMCIRDRSAAGPMQYVKPEFKVVKLQRLRFLRPAPGCKARGCVRLAVYRETSAGACANGYTRHCHQRTAVSRYIATTDLLVIRVSSRGPAALASSAGSKIASVAWRDGGALCTACRAQGNFVATALVDDALMKRKPGCRPFDVVIVPVCHGCARVDVSRT